MSDFDLALALNADGSQVVAEVDRATASLGRLSRAEREAATQSRALESSTANVARQQVAATAAEAARVRQLAEVALREKQAATAARETAQARVNSSRGSVELTAENPTITLSPGQRAATGDARELAAASRALAEARRVEEQAERTLAARLQESAAASQASQSAAAQLAQASGNASAATERLARDLGLSSVAGDGAAQAARETASANEGQSAAARAASAASEQHGQATAAEAGQMDRAARTAAELAAAEVRLAGATTQAEREAAAAAIAAARLDQAQGRARGSADAGADAANRQAYAVRNVGQQFGDFGLSIAGGIDPARAFGQQAGQLGFALSEMGGTLGKVGAFLVGPWGIALTVGAAVLAPLISKLFDAGKAADESREKLEAAAQAADSYGNAQSLLGRIIDLTTGKLKTQNVVLIETIKLQARANILAAQKAQQTGLAGLAGAASPTAGETISDVVKVAGAGDLTGALVTFLDVAQRRGSALGPLTRDLKAYTVEAKAYQAVLNDPRASAATVNAAAARFGTSLSTTITKLGSSAKAAGRDVIDAQTQVVQLGISLQDQRANQAALIAANGGPIDAILKPYDRPGAPKKPEKPKSTEARDEFGRDTAAKLASIREGLSDTPPVVRQVNQQLRQLDDIIDDLARKKPPGFEKLIADANALKPLVVDSINRPFNDYVKAQQDSLAIAKLTTAGRLDEADALRTILALEKQAGPLTPARKDAVLATVEALRAEQRQMEINRAQVGLYLDSLGEIKSIVAGATKNLGDLVKAPGRIVTAFQDLQGKVLFEKLFGDAFRELEDQVNGTASVESSSERMADAVDQVTTATETTTTALGDLTTAARGAAGAIVGGPSATPTVVAAVAAAAGTVGGEAAVGDLAKQLAQGNGVAGPGEDAAGDIEVTGTRAPRTPAIRQSPTALFGGAAETLARSLGIGASSKARDAALIDLARDSGLSGKSDAELLKQAKDKGLKLADDTASKIGKNVGKGLEGAATGAAVNSLLEPLGKALGFKTSKLGAQVGGAVGSFLPIPFGKEIGAVVGSVIGGLFKKTKTGSATIGNVDGEAAVTGTSGNNSGQKKASSALGDSIGSTLNDIVDQLGGDLGNFAVSIGKRDKKFVVDGSGSGKTKGGGTQKFDTAEEAQAAALRDAIVDGAVDGVSDAIQAALRQNADVSKALSEALKVREVERFIASASDQLKLAFDDQARSSADRLRIAKRYGIDVLAVEKANAAERAKLVEDALKSQVGSLQDVLSSLASGDLFEGTAAERRKAILADISATRVKADAGEEGAAETLATLYRNLLANTRENYGTAGPELNDDRALVQSGATAVIEEARARVAAAAGSQQATTTAVEKNNALTDESNNLLAKIAGTLAGMSNGAGSGGGGGSFDLSALSRIVQI